MRPVSSARPMKSAGIEQAASGCLPADERLDPDDVPVGQVDDGLVVEPELVAILRSAQQRLERRPLADRLAQARPEDLVAALAAVLRLVHREVGVAQELGRAIRAAASSRRSRRWWR